MVRKNFYRDIFNVEEWTVQLEHGCFWAVLDIRFADSKGVTSAESEAYRYKIEKNYIGKNGRLLMMNLVKMTTWFKQLLVTYDFHTDYAAI